MPVNLEVIGSSRGTINSNQKAENFDNLNLPKVLAMNPNDIANLTHPSSHTLEMNEQQLLQSLPTRQEYQRSSQFSQLRVDSRAIYVDKMGPTITLMNLQEGEADEGVLDPDMHINNAKAERQLKLSSPTNPSFVVVQNGPKHEGSPMSLRSYIGQTQSAMVRHVSPTKQNSNSSPSSAISKMPLHSPLAKKLKAGSPVLNSPLIINSEQRMQKKKKRKNSTPQRSQQKVHYHVPNPVPSPQRESPQSPTGLPMIELKNNPEPGNKSQMKKKKSRLGMLAEQEFKPLFSSRKGGASDMRQYVHPTGVTRDEISTLKPQSQFGEVPLIVIDSEGKKKIISGGEEDYDRQHATTQLGFGTRLGSQQNSQENFGGGDTPENKGVMEPRLSQTDFSSFIGKKGDSNWQAQTITLQVPHFKDHPKGPALDQQGHLSLLPYNQTMGKTSDFQFITPKNSTVQEMMSQINTNKYAPRVHPKPHKQNHYQTQLADPASDLLSDPSKVYPGEQYKAISNNPQQLFPGQQSHQQAHEQLAYMPLAHRSGIKGAPLIRHERSRSPSPEVKQQKATRLPNALTVRTSPQAAASTLHSPTSTRSPQASEQIFIADGTQFASLQAGYEPVAVRAHGFNQLQPSGSKVSTGRDFWPEKRHGRPKLHHPRHIRKPKYSMPPINSRNLSLAQTTLKSKEFASKAGLPTAEILYDNIQGTEFATKSAGSVNSDRYRAGVTQMKNMNQRVSKPRGLLADRTEDQMFRTQELSKTSFKDPVQNLLQHQGSFSKEKLIKAVLALKKPIDTTKILQDDVTYLEHDHESTDNQNADLMSCSQSQLMQTSVSFKKMGQGETGRKILSSIGSEFSFEKSRGAANEVEQQGSRPYLHKTCMNEFKSSTRDLVMHTMETPGTSQQKMQVILDEIIQSSKNVKKQQKIKVKGKKVTHKQSFKQQYMNNVGCQAAPSEKDSFRMNLDTSSVARLHMAGQASSRPRDATRCDHNESELSLIGTTLKAQDKNYDPKSKHQYEMYEQHNLKKRTKNKQRTTVMLKTPNHASPVFKGSGPVIATTQMTTQNYQSMQQSTQQHSPLKQRENLHLNKKRFINKPIKISQRRFSLPEPNQKPKSILPQGTLERQIAVREANSDEEGNTDGEHDESVSATKLEKYQNFEKEVDQINRVITDSSTQKFIIQPQEMPDMIFKDQSVLSDFLQSCSLSEKGHCLLCHQFCTQPTRMQCNHVVCLYCFKLALSSFKDCPICQQQLLYSGAKLTVDEQIEKLLLKINPLEYASLRKDRLNRGQWFTRYGGITKLEFGSGHELMWKQTIVGNRRMWQKYYKWKMFLMIDRCSEITSKYIQEVAYYIYNKDKQRQACFKKYVPPFTLKRESESQIDQMNPIKVKITFRRWTNLEPYVLHHKLDFNRSECMVPQFIDNGKQFWDLISPLELALQEKEQNTLDQLLEGLDRIKSQNQKSIKNQQVTSQGGVSGLKLGNSICKSDFKEGELSELLQKIYQQSMIYQDNQQHQKKINQRQTQPRSLIQNSGIYPGSPQMSTQLSNGFLSHSNKRSSKLLLQTMNSITFSCMLPKETFA